LGTNYLFLRIWKGIFACRHYWGCWLLKEVEIV
jgi:hypothetical protein